MAAAFDGILAADMAGVAASAARAVADDIAENWVAVVGETVDAATGSLAFDAVCHRFGLDAADVAAAVDNGADREAAESGAVLVVAAIVGYAVGAVHSVAVAADAAADTASAGYGDVVVDDYDVVVANTTCPDGCQGSEFGDVVVAANAVLASCFVASPFADGDNGALRRDETGDILAVEVAECGAAEVVVAKVAWSNHVAVAVSARSEMENNTIDVAVK